MMRKTIMLAAVSLTAFLITAGCSSSKSEGGTNEVTGQIVVVGNEPFTHLAVKTSPSEVFILDCSKQIKDRLLNNQGKLVKIFFSSKDTTQKPPVLKVEKAKIISKDFQ